jgi:hypothetical protein
VVVEFWVMLPGPVAVEEWWVTLAGPAMLELKVYPEL